VDDSGEGKSQVTEEVHAPPSNIGSIEAAEKLREKMETIREKRRQYKKLSGVRTLGEPDDDESALAWVQKFNQIQEERDKAERRAQMLTEMDEEFGVGDLIQETLEHQNQQSYSASDLKGLTVEHKTEEFIEGRSVVLTLKDAGVLEEADDVLVNTNMLEAEHAARNIDIRKKKRDYDPYEEMEEEETKSSVLKKYDEEIEGVKRETFELEEFGDVDTSRQREADIVKRKLESQALTLEQTPAKVASEYFTADEMVQFRKPKRKKKVRRLKADDLLGMTAEKDDSEQRDHGARKKKTDDSDDGLIVKSSKCSQ
jgi:U4/U6.U5 tri-snRNP-associated protein 1